MTNPFFSIITITKDNLPGLKKTQRTIELQNFTDFEWIVQDGLSTDSTPEFMADKNAKYESASDAGIYDAINKAMARSAGKYLIFMNAGDYFVSENILQKIAGVIEQNDSDFLYGDAVERRHLKKARRIKDFSQGMITHHQAMVFRRETIGDLKYDTQYGIAADYDFCLRFLPRAKVMTYLNFPVCVYAPGGLSQKNALQGRKEQYKIRAALGYAKLSNIGVFMGQSGLYALRLVFPALYWRLKEQR